jgi:hypothetical protein
MRYRDMERIDLDAAREAVCAWLDEHQHGTLAQMAEDLKWRYPAFPDEMAVVLRGMMAAELRRRTRRGNVSALGAVGCNRRGVSRDSYSEPGSMRHDGRTL